MAGVHLAELLILLVVLGLVLLPIIIGFAWVLPDANRRDQPGWLWALLTIPLGWMALLAYVLVRALLMPHDSR